MKRENLNRSELWLLFLDNAHWLRRHGARGPIVRWPGVAGAISWFFRTNMHAIFQADEVFSADNDKSGASMNEKLSRDAAPSEILQGQHGPTNLPGAGDVMTDILSTLRNAIPGWHFALFAFEPPENAAADNRLPRFNYGSTVERADMLAVLKAFILKNEDPAEYARQAKLDEFRTKQTTEGKG